MASFMESCHTPCLFNVYPTLMNTDFSQFQWHLEMFGCHYLICDSLIVNPDWRVMAHMSIPFTCKLLIFLSVSTEDFVAVVNEGLKIRINFFFILLL